MQETVIKADTVYSWLADNGYSDNEAKDAVRKMQCSERFEGSHYELVIRVNAFSGYSGTYTEDAMDCLQRVAHGVLYLAFADDGKALQDFEISRTDFKATTEV